jgi:hypothetical protein
MDQHQLLGRSGSTFTTWQAWINIHYLAGLLNINYMPGLDHNSLPGRSVSTFTISGRTVGRPGSAWITINYMADLDQHSLPGRSGSEFNAWQAWIKIN